MKSYKFAQVMTASAVAVLTATALAGCSSGSSGTGSKEIVLGLTAPLTGDAAATGQEIKQAATMALEKANYTVGGYKIKPVWIDEGGDPATASANFTSAVQGKKIQAGCLNWQSSQAVAMMDIAARYRIPYFFGMGATSIVNEKFTSDQDKYGYWMTKGYPIPGNIAKLYVSAVDSFVAGGQLKLTHGKRVAVWAEDTDWGHSFAESQSESFKAAGWTVVSSQFVASDSTDFSGMLQKFKNQDVSVIASTNASPQGMSAFLKQSRDSRSDAVIIADGLGYIGDFYKTAGAASDGVLDMQPQFSSPEAAAFAQGFKEKYGSDPSPTSAGISYDLMGYCLKTLAATIDTFGDASSKHIFQTGKDEIWTGKLTYDDGIMMPRYAYSADTLPDPTVGPEDFAIPVVQYEGGKANVVFPAGSGATAFKQP